MAINLGGGLDQVARDRQAALINASAMSAQGYKPGLQSPQDKELQQRRGILDSGYANARGLLQPMAAGQNWPFNQQVVQGLNAGASDNAAGQMRAARAVIDRSFGRQGLAGSGGAMRARLDAQRQIGKGLRQEQTAIGTRAALGNADYQRSAIRDLMGLLGMETAYQGQFTNNQPTMDPYAALLGMSEGSGMGGMGLGTGFGGGGGGGGFGQPDGLQAQWLRDQARTEEEAAAIRARNAAQAAALAGGQQGPSPYGGLLKMASGWGGSGPGGSLKPGEAGVPWDGGSGGGGFASISGPYGSYSGNPEDVLMRILADNPSGNRGEPVRGNAGGVPYMGGTYWSNAGPGWGMVTPASPGPSAFPDANQRNANFKADLAKRDQAYRSNLYGRR